MPFSNRSCEGSRQQLFHMCYRFLQLFCAHNLANQHAVASDPRAVPTALAHFDYDLGADNFLIALHEKNYHLTCNIHNDVITAFVKLGLRFVRSRACYAARRDGMNRIRVRRRYGLGGGTGSAEVRARRRYGLGGWAGRPENCSAGGGGGVTWTPAEGGGWRNGVPRRALCFV